MQKVLPQNEEVFFEQSKKVEIKFLQLVYFLPSWSTVNWENEKSNSIWTKKWNFESIESSKMVSSRECAHRVEMEIKSGATSLSCGAAGSDGAVWPVTSAGGEKKTKKKLYGRWRGWRAVSKKCQVMMDRWRPPTVSVNSVVGWPLRPSNSRGRFSDTTQITVATLVSDN